MEFFFNASTYESTGFSSCELHFGKSPTDKILEILKFPESIESSRDMNIMMAKERLNKCFEWRKNSQGIASTVSFVEVDLVLLRVPKRSQAVEKVTMKFFFFLWALSNNRGL